MSYRGFLLPATCSRSTILATEFEPDDEIEGWCFTGEFAQTSQALAAVVLAVEDHLHQDFRDRTLEVWSPRVLDWTVESFDRQPLQER